MAATDEEFLKRLQAAFKIEAEEHTQAMSSGLLELESGAPAGEQQAAIIEKIYREAHSLKGAARAVNMLEIETVCQALESIFSAWKRKELAPAPQQFDTLHRAVDFVGELLSGESAAARGPQIVAMTKELTDLRQGKKSSPATPPPSQPQPPPSAPVSPEPAAAEAVHPAPPTVSPAAPAAVETPPAPVTTEQRHAPPSSHPSAATETVRISTMKLDAVLLQAEEMLIAKLQARQQAQTLNGLVTDLKHWRKEWGKIEPDFRRTRSRNDETSLNDALATFLDWSQSHIAGLEDRLSTLAATAERDRRSLGSMVDNLLDETKKLVMLPFSSLLEIFPRLVRDLARDEGKDVQLFMHGQEVEIDKRILEEMKDPLIHILRNSVDHGIEQPSERAPKPPRATIELRVSQTGGSEVEICITDDGRGIDAEKVKASAMKKGIINAEEASRLDEQGAIALIFQSEVSTSPIITEISGRGLGMAIVREKIQKLGGRISIETTLGEGTTFRLFLPLTLATFKGILVRASDQTFVIPATDVDRVVRVKPDQIQPVENRDTIPLDGRVVSLVRLDDTLELPRRDKPNEAGENSIFPVLILGSGEKQIGFRVDEVVNEQEVLVKPLGKPLVRVRNVSAATVLGDGKPAVILNVADLMKSAVKLSTAARRAGPESSPEADAKKSSVLVVEDSITSRMLLKNILESAGFTVTTAVDGMDGLSRLRAGAFDVVVSDVDMPRMDGFELTAAIRADRRLAPLPVVLVTARETREDRERGIDVGANAYIVKSSFDQSDLLNVIRRLV